MNFSVLMSIYYKENPEYFNRAMKSIWDEQTLKPTEIILIEDGPLTKELYSLINFWKEKLGHTMKVIVLERNGGLAKALNIGIEHSTCELIARMDTDDISSPQRFEKQIAFLEKNKKIDVLGTYIKEIDEKGKEIKPLVEYPLEHKELYLFFKKRDPIAHPTAMFRNSFFEKAGNYRSDLYLAEDTVLWYHGFLNKCKFANINYIGLKYRRTQDFYIRRADKRKTMQLLRYRLDIINKNLKYGFIADFYAFVYFCMSLAPSFIKKIMYKVFR